MPWPAGIALLGLLLSGAPEYAQSLVSASTLSFGAQVVNQPGEPLGATFRNSGKGSLVIQRLAISGDAAGDYATGGDCPPAPGTLAAGKSCTIRVTFTPSAAGLRTATLTISAPGDALPRTIALKGIGVASADFAAAGVVANTPAANSNQPDAGNAAPATNTSEKIVRRPTRPGVSTGSGLLPGNLAALSSTGTAIGLVSIVVSPANSSISAGSTQQFTATGIYSDGASINLTSEVGWGSSAPGIATINGAGLATGVIAGSTVITATYASVSSPPVAKADSVTVTAPPIVVSSPSALSGSTTLTVTGPAVGFSTTGSLNTARNGHTATLLDNGLVLVAGGYNGNTLASAELYNPATETFTLTGSLNTARSTHTATLLNNGMVLVVGGYNNSGAIAGAELYDPATGTFTLTGSLNTARSTHTATLLNNGMVLIAGGVGSSGQPMPATAELYNPDTGTFTTTGSLNTARWFHTATLLPNGTVLIAGGYNGASLASAELYNPATGTFTLTGTMNNPRFYHTATLLNNGVVLMAGGAVDANFDPTNTAELYNPATGTFTSAGSMTAYREEHTATLLNDGLVLIAGGNNGTYLSSAELYDPGPGTFTATGSLNTAREAQTATLLNDGLVLIAGGYNGVFLASAELYQPATLTPPNLLSISLAPGNPSMPLRTSLGFVATGTLAGGVTEPLASVSWSSSDPGVISVSSDASNAGTAYAAAAGSATISACAGSICGSTIATVTPQLISITVTPSSNTIAPGATAQFFAVGNLDTGSTIDLTSSVNWSSSAPAVATIAAGGLAAALTAGYTTITATLGSVQGTAVLTVTNVVAAVPTGSMITARALATVTQIPEVFGDFALVVGGLNSTGAVSSAEVYVGGIFQETTGPLNTARYGHTATLLNSGEVLVTGGYNTALGEYLASAELFNPNPMAATFAYTSGNLNTPRYGHTATLLNNGMVLIAGGFNESGYLASAELYDPTTQTFMPTGSLNTARTLHTATLLPNGMVLIAGGENASGALQSAELYDPLFGNFIAISGMTSARYLHTATLLNDGQVLIAGGAAGSSFLTAAELYNSALGTFNPAGSLNVARDWHSATLLSNGTVLVAGGQNGGDYLSSTEIYDPFAGSFTLSGSLPAAVAATTSTLLTNGSVLVAGGFDSGGYFDTAEIYTPATLSPPGLASIAVSPAAPTISPGTNQQFVAMATFSDGSTLPLAAVEWSSSNASLAQISTDVTNPGQALAVSNPGSNTDVTITASVGNVSGTATLTVRPTGFVTTGSLNTGRYLHTATLLNNGLVLIAGGYSGSAPDGTGSAELYNPTTGTFTLTGSLNTARAFYTATLLNNGLVLIAGGYGGNSSPFGYLQSAELYNPATGTFTSTGSLNTARSGHTATLLNNDLVLIAGGYSGSAPYGTGSAELYNPTTGTFTLTGSLNTARASHTATLLNNGLVLIAGGYGGNSSPFGYLQSAELYNPATGTFTLTGSLTTARYLHTATLLNNGLVLIAGGYNGSYLNSAELYNPAAGTFALTPGSLNTARDSHTATLLNNGLVLIAGGFNPSNPIGYLSSAELYNPATGRFTLTSSLNTAREDHTATLLSNGLVLIAGGYSDNPEEYVTSAELY